MITTANEYYQYLHQIQNDNPPTIALIPNREKTYLINLEERTVEAPKFLSIEKDHAAETIYFLVDRYYDYVDLSSMICIIQYINADNEAKIYPVPFFDIQTYSKEKKMLIPWNIGAGATKSAGPVQYTFRFYRLNELGTAFKYNLNTKTAVSEVLYGMDAQELNEEDFTFSASQYDTLLSKIEEIDKRDLYWTDLYSM